MWVEKHGPRWRIRDRVGGKLCTIASGYPNKTSAETARKVLEAEQLRGDALVPRGGRITLNAFIDAWWPGYERGLKPTARHSEGGRVRNHIRPLLGSMTLEEIELGALAIQRWIADLSDGVGPMPGRKRRPLAPKTVHNCHGLLHTILNAAVVQRLIRVNPCGATATCLPARVHREMRFLTDPEIARLVAAMPGHWRPLVLLLVATGLRWGEAIGLRAGRVDLLASKPKLLVVEQLQEMSGGGSELIFTGPKTARSRRTVSFTRQVALALAPLVAGKARDELVFLTPTGAWVRTRNFRRIWLKACERTGLAGLRVHDLRHSHAAILISAGRPLSAISRRLGHSSIAVTDTLYGHIREEADEGILAAVESALAKIGTEDLQAEVAQELADSA
jgi:integrase